MRAVIVVTSAIIVVMSRVGTGAGDSAGRGAVKAGLGLRNALADVGLHDIHVCIETQQGGVVTTLEAVGWQALTYFLRVVSWLAI